jgi:hypothetical protein
VSGIPLVSVDCETMRLNRYVGDKLTHRANAAKGSLSSSVIEEFRTKPADEFAVILSAPLKHFF